MKKKYESDEIMKKDYQPGANEFAGKMFGTANMYMERKERQMSKDAKEIRNKSYKGRYS